MAIKFCMKHGEKSKNYNKRFFNKVKLINLPNYLLESIRFELNSFLQLSFSTNFQQFELEISLRLHPIPSGATKSVKFRQHFFFPFIFRISRIG